VKGDLERLIAAVEAGTADDDAPDGTDLWWNVWPRKDGPQAGSAWRAYSGSIDAAHESHMRLLPGWEWEIQCGGDAVVSNRKMLSIQVGSVPDNPARAWLLAILRALAKREEG
jgi:hypothetical protein